MTKLKHWVFLFVLVGSVLVIDQASKHVIMAHLAMGETAQPIPAISAVFQFTRSYNTGAAFGFLSQSGGIFLVIALVVVVAMFYYYPRVEGDAWVQRAAMGLVCGGALGNALDRLQHGHVVDFIHYQIPGVISNVSNLADHAIVLGVLLLMFDLWRMERQPAAAEDQAEEQRGA